MKQLFAYIRVSKPKKGGGVSLEQQQAVIERYVAQQQLTIAAWFKEKRTAATQGRPVFNEMMRQLRKGKASGVVMHKVDRSARNLRDWTDLADLVETGVELHFAHDALDMRSRGGRLSADLQAVIAADYIRNLREEALKGIEGRLKQGLLPHHAPIGYLDRGPGLPKAIDPVRAPIVRKLFERYDEGDCTLRDLTEVARKLGLRNSRGNALRLTQIHWMLRNIFYAGVLRSARFGVFAGIHEPIVGRALFDRVQLRLAGKYVHRSKHHNFLFRRMVRCQTCGRSLIGSRVKGRVYYRCSTRECPTTSLREDAIEGAVHALLDGITLPEEEGRKIEAELADERHVADEFQASRRRALTQAREAADARLTRLTDLLIDERIDAATHDERRAALVLERQAVEQELSGLDGARGDEIDAARRIVELMARPISLYEQGNDDQKRRLLEIVMSNCSASGRTIEISLREPFASFARKANQQDCRGYWYTARTFSVVTLITQASAIPKALLDALDLATFPDAA